MVTAKKKNHIDKIWDFRNAYTKTYTHCYHIYPAMMIPQIATRLIDIYGVNACNLFDPYCGSGTTLVEANLKGMNAYGTDLNPLARLISQTKTLKIDLSVLDISLQEFDEFYLFENFSVPKPELSVPSFKNIDFWFKQETKYRLASVKNFIDTIKDEKVANFFLVAFSETIRETSLTKNGEFKLLRMSEKQRHKFHPDVFSIMISKLTRNRNGLSNYLKKIRDLDVKTVVYDFDTTFSTGEIQKESIDIIITSPPYGDSKTTVAYGQFSRLSNQWLGVKNASKVDNSLMGGKAKNIQSTGLPIIDITVEMVANVDKKRAQDVYSFYVDYSNSIKNISNILKSGGFCCYVVGNRKVKGIILPTAEITRALFERHGFIHIDTFIRNIPNKRMPPVNSPTNEAGKIATTMNNEYIVIMKKDI